MSWFQRKKDSPTKAEVPIAPIKVLKVSDYLTEQTILILNANTPKRDIFAKLIEALKLPDADTALKAVLTREETASTVIEPGIALPHARIAGLKGIHAALAVLPTGSSQQDATTETIKLCLLFLGPSENMKEHLAFLSSVASLFQNEGLRDSLLQQNSPKAVLDQIRAAEGA